MWALTTASDGNGIDREALRRTYAAERDRRLRRDGADQYLRPGTTEAPLGHYLADPFTPDRPARAAIVEDTDVLMVGGGFGGLLTGARLRELGIADFRIVENAGDFGGTWYWNRYPGVACDIESTIYMPRLEQLGTLPTMRYASGPEILHHCQAMGRHFDLYQRALFQTRVTGMAWDDSCGRWIVTTDRGDRIRARFVAMSTGPLNQAKLPGVPGIADFAGHSFHTSRWDYGYTGGDASGGLTGLAGKRVGIIGTGATAIQCVPHLAAGAGQLCVFQRTPSTIQPRDNRPIDPAWARGQAPGWQARRIEAFSALIVGEPAEDDFDDGWTKTFQELFALAGVPAAEVAAALEMNDLRVMERIRRHIADLVDDPATAAALQPYYSLLCKRMGFSDEYLQAFNRPNVRLVDTRGQGVERIVPEGVIANGELHALDCLIFATGFEWLTEHKLGSGFEIVGRGGLAQSEAWRDGVLSLYGIHSRGFPNRFVIGNSQQPLTANFAHAIDIVVEHIAHLIRHCLDHGIATVEPTEAAQAAWVDEVVAINESRRAANEACTPGYYNNEGQSSLRVARNGSCGGAVNAFSRMLAAQRQSGVYEGLELR